MSEIKKLSVWGDSILKGVIWDTDKNKYRTTDVSAVDILSQNAKIDVKNFSKFGCTSTKALALLKKYLLKGTKEDAALIEVGGNDCDHTWEEISKKPSGKHKANVSLDDFVQNMKEFIKELQSEQIKPVLMNLPPIDFNKYFDWIVSSPNIEEKNIMTWLKEKSAIYRNQEMYSQAINQIAYTCSVPFIDVRSKFLSIKNLTTYFCLDGIHLNEKGHEFLGSIFCEFAANYKIGAINCI